MSKVDFVYTKLSSFHHWLYQKRILSTVSVDVPVLSVGNLSFGGAGKTPFVIWLSGFLNQLAQKKNKSLHSAVISKAYRSSISEPTRVDLQKDQGAVYFGDEPYLVAQNIQPQDVFVGASKSDTALYVSGLKKYHFLIVDDGFQHFRLKRNLDFVLLNTSKGDEILKREDWQALGRAEIIVLTYVNWATPEQKKSLQSRLPNHNKKIILEAKSESFIESYSQKFQFLENEFANKKIFSFSSIADSKNFQKNIQNLNPRIYEHQDFSDHYQFTLSDLDYMTERAQNFDCVMMTEKDAVKIQCLLRKNTKKDLENKLFVLKLKFHIEGNLDKLEKRLSEILF